MGRSEQTKGRRGERELSRILNEYGFQTRPGAPVSFGGEPDIIGLDGVHVEVKRAECPNVCAALKQAGEDAEYFGDGVPVVFWRKNRGRWCAIMELDTFVSLLRGEVTGDAAGCICSEDGSAEVR
jgi:Holliday junction resolvase